MKDKFKDSLQKAEKRFTPPILHDRWDEIKSRLPERELANEKFSSRLNEQSSSRLWMKIAAGVLFLVVAGTAFIYFSQDDKEEMAYEYKSTEATAVEEQPSADADSNIEPLDEKIAESKQEEPISKIAEAKPEIKDKEIFASAVKEEAVDISESREQNEAYSAPAPAVAAEAAPEMASARKDVDRSMKTQSAGAGKFVLAITDYNGKYNNKDFTAQLNTKGSGWILTGNMNENPNLKFVFSVSEGTLFYTGPDGTENFNLESEKGKLSNFISENGRISVMKDEDEIQISLTRRKSDVPTTHKWNLKKNQ